MGWFCFSSKMDRAMNDMLARIESLEFARMRANQPLRESVGISAFAAHTFDHSDFVCRSIDVECLLARMKKDGIDIQKYSLNIGPGLF